MPTYQKTVASFLSSRFFPLTVALTVFVCHTVGADLIGGGILLLFLLLGFLFAEDIRFFIPLSCQREKLPHLQSRRNALR